MDFESFENDLRTEAKKLPPELLLILKELAGKFGPQLEALIMPMIGNLGRHIQTIMLEVGLGVLDRKAVEDSVMKVLKEII